MWIIIPIPNEKVIKNRMGIIVFRRKTPRRENIYPPELSQLVSFSSVKGISQLVTFSSVKGIPLFCISQTIVQFIRNKGT
jgi:hypothetical protein